MEESLAREVQIAEQVPASPTMAPLPEWDDTVLSPHVQELISRCMDGTEPLVDAKPWHVKKLNTAHIQAIMLRTAGFRPPEIAQMIGYEVQVVAQLMSHPYAKKIFKAMAPAQYTRVIDIKTRMEQQASELMDKLFTMAFVSDEIKEVKEVTFGFLDRAGYGAVNKSAAVVGTPADFSKTSEKTLSRLANALDESRIVDAAVMPNWTPPKPPDEGSMSSSRFDIFGSAAEERVGSPQPQAVPKDQHSTDLGPQSAEHS